LPSALLIITKDAPGINNLFQALSRLSILLHTINNPAPILRCSKMNFPLTLLHHKDALGRLLPKQVQG